MNEQGQIHWENLSCQKYLWLLKAEANQHDIPFEVIGNELSEYTGIQYPIYRIVIHPEVQKTICIIAGVHGNEIAGPFSILKLLRTSIHELPENYRYLIYPMINPGGFDLRRRYDDDDRDLNAIYSKTLASKNYHEVQALYEDMQKFWPFESVVALHEDIDVENFYIYGIGEQNVAYYHELCKVGNYYCSPWSNADIYGDQSDEFGLIHANARDHAYDGYLYTKGLAPIAITFETPGRLDLDLRIRMMEKQLISSVCFLENRGLWSDDLNVNTHHRGREQH